MEIDLELTEKSAKNTQRWWKLTATICLWLCQGLTQTFLSSGPQDHQLRESGGPTIFLVVLRIKSQHTNSYAYIIKKWVS